MVNFPVRSPWDFLLVIEGEPEVAFVNRPLLITLNACQSKYRMATAYTTVKSELNIEVSQRGRKRMHSRSSPSNNDCLAAKSLIDQGHKRQIFIRKFQKPCHKGFSTLVSHEQSTLKPYYGPIMHTCYITAEVRSD